MSVLLAAILASVGSYYLVRYVSNKVRHGAGDGTLVYLPALERMGWLALLGSGALGWHLFKAGTDAERLWFALALAAALLAAGYFLGEGLRSGGYFDNSGIRFTTLWGGTRNELWRDLRSVRYRRGCAWYVLTFKSGKKIRLSVLLYGHGGVLQRLRALGHHV